MRYSNSLEMEEAANGREGLDAVVRQQMHVEMLVTMLLDSTKPRLPRPVPSA